MQINLDTKIIIVLGAVLKWEVSLNREKGLESKAWNKKKNLTSYTLRQLPNKY